MAPVAVITDPKAVSIQGDVAVATQQENRSWKARLDLVFEAGREKTILRRRHFGPLVIQRPFYPEGRVCHAYVLHPPGGVVGGDRLRMAVRCDDHASGLITTPGANRFYGSDGRQAEQIQTLDVGGGCFEWLPAETIYFDRARVAQRLRIDLTGTSRFVGWDISCFGRVAGNHFFNEGNVTNRLEIFRDGQPLLVERLQVTGEADLLRVSGMRGATVFGTMLLTAPDCIDNDLLDAVRKQLANDRSFAATLVDELITVRYLGANAEEARSGFMRVWSGIRPVLMSGVQATAPRIWAT